MLIEAYDSVQYHAVSGQEYSSTVEKDVLYGEIAAPGDLMLAPRRSAMIEVLIGRQLLSYCLLYNYSGARVAFRQPC